VRGRGASGVRGQGLEAKDGRIALEGEREGERERGREGERGRAERNSSGWDGSGERVGLRELAVVQSCTAVGGGT